MKERKRLTGKKRTELKVADENDVMFETQNSRFGTISNVQTRQSQ